MSWIQIQINTFNNRQLKEGYIVSIIATASQTN